MKFTLYIFVIQMKWPQRTGFKSVCSLLSKACRTLSGVLSVTMPVFHYTRTTMCCLTSSAELIFITHVDPGIPINSCPNGFLFYFHESKDKFKKLDKHYFVFFSNNWYDSAEFLWVWVTIVVSIFFDVVLDANAKVFKFCWNIKGSRCWKIQYWHVDYMETFSRQITKRWNVWISDGCVTKD